MKCFFFFVLFLIINASHPLYDSFSDLYEEIEENLSFNEYLIKFLLPSYKENAIPKFQEINMEIQSKSQDFIKNERILPALQECNGVGKNFNLTRINYYCHNKTVSKQYYNGIILKLHSL